MWGLVEEEDPPLLLSSLRVPSGDVLLFSGKAVSGELCQKKEERPRAPPEFVRKRGVSPFRAARA